MNASEEPADGAVDCDWWAQNLYRENFYWRHQCPKRKRFRALSPADLLRGACPKCGQRYDPDFYAPSFDHAAAPAILAKLEERRRELGLEVQ